jgi:hypothetical protein
MMKDRLTLKRVIMSRRRRRPKGSRQFSFVLFATYPKIIEDDPFNDDFSSRRTAPAMEKLQHRTNAANKGGRWRAVSVSLKEMLNSTRSLLLESLHPIPRPGNRPEAQSPTLVVDDTRDQGHLRHRFALEPK